MGNGPCFRRRRDTYEEIGEPVSSCCCRRRRLGGVLPKEYRDLYRPFVTHVPGARCPLAHRHHHHHHHHDDDHGGQRSSRCERFRGSVLAPLLWLPRALLAVRDALRTSTGR